MTNLRWFETGGNEEYSDAVQRLAFLLGYSWTNSGQKIGNTKATHLRFDCKKQQITYLTNPKDADGKYNGQGLYTIPELVRFLQDDRPPTDDPQIQKSLLRALQDCMTIAMGGQT